MSSPEYRRMKSEAFAKKSTLTALVTLVVSVLLPDCVLCLMSGHYSLYDDLCDSRPSIIPVPWDCTGYIRCDTSIGGRVRALWTLCDPGHEFNPQVSKCVAGFTGCLNPYEAAVTFCPEFAALTFLHPGSCSMFYNCSQISSRGPLRQYESECPYPQLFDADIWKCVPRSTDNGLADFCGQRSVPCNPCDYTVGCGASDRCVGLANGPQPDAKNVFAPDYIICQNSTVAKATSCQLSGQIFDPNSLQCVFGVRDESVTEYCAKKPYAVFADPYHCARYYNCSQVTWHTGLRAKQNECKYPLLFDVITAKCVSFHDVKCGTREEPIQPCDYILGHCLDRPECIPCQASCLGLPNGYNSYPGFVLTAYHIVCENGRTVDILNCTKGLVFDPQLRTCGSQISPQTLDLYCAQNPDGKLPHPSECSLLYDCTHLMVKPNFPKYVSECKYPYLVDADTAQCRPHDQVECRDRREPISPCDYLGNQCTSPQCTRCDLIMPSCYGKLNGFYSVINQEMTSSYMECRDQRVVSLSSCPGGLIFDMVDRKCVDTVSQVSMLQFCTNFLQGRVQSPGNCAQYYDCTQNLTTVKECNYPDLYHVETRQCKHYTEVDCGGRRVFLDPCDSYTFCPHGPCPYCPSAFPTCMGRNGAIGGFNFDPRLYYRCIDNRMILGQCQTVYNRDLKRCNESSVASTTAVALQSSTPKTSKFPLIISCYLCDYKMQHCPPDSIGKTCTPCHERFPTCAGRTDGPWPLPRRLSPLYIRYNRSLLLVIHQHSDSTPPALRALSIMQRKGDTSDGGECSYPNLFSNGLCLNFKDVSCVLVSIARDPAKFCGQYPGAVVADPLHCARYYNCSRTGPAHFGRPYLSECRYPALFNRQTMKCDSFITVQRTAGCGSSKQPIHQCEYSAYCPNTQYRTCSDCYLSLPTCRHLTDGIHTLPPGRLVSRGFVYCLDQRALVFSECPPGFLFVSNSKTCVLKGTLPLLEPPEVK
ncbi:hypothetical protein C0Q70_21430 [Pomacea canaliculata]|uniref:Chitin-binding type-2 domain-containing protein n=1 Tax=Pomacea canaliculata TaxID=400727 RepID=A0A2T7NCH1_POMCA|nr:hypothetical protein C0Q70_21430 [Pomacea canaliculata]